jgi:Protein of unknown function (DUF3043)
VARNSQSTTTQKPDEDIFAGSKGHRTPTRKEKEDARKRPLVSSDRSVSRAQARVADQQKREKARQGMANGDERYLPIKDRGVQKRYVRDYIDARWSFGEFLIPVMVGVLLLSLLPENSLIPLIGMATLYLYLFISVIDCVIVGFIVRKKLGAKFGVDKIEGGVRWYAAMRAVQLRLMRLPKPQVKRGVYPA